MKTLSNNAVNGNEMRILCLIFFYKFCSFRDKVRLCAFFRTSRYSDSIIVLIELAHSAKYKESRISWMCLDIFK
jgi:hypothetical protein